MFKSRSGPRALAAIAGTVALVVAACTSSTATPAPSAAAPSEAAASVAASATPEPTPLVTAAPIDASVPGPNGGQIIRWFVGQVREAASDAGRDPASIRIQAAAPAHLGPRDVGRERTRWFPALVSNHVVDLVNKYPREQLPDALTGYITDRHGYDYHHHAEVGSSNAAFVGDEVTDRFCVLGEADEHIAKLHELADAGVDQFNLYLMNGDEEAQLEAYGRDIVPALRV